MSVEIPYINSLRFKKSDIDIDYNDVMPFQDKEVFNEQYQRGIYPVNYKTVFVTGNELSFFIKVVDTAVRGYAYLQENGVTTKNFSRSSITLNGDLYEFYKITITTAGTYRVRLDIRLTSGYNYYYSDDIIIRSSNKDLVKFNFYDTQNRYGGYWFSDAETQLWNPVCYYTGLTITADPEDETNQYSDEQGNDILISSNPKRIESLKLTDIHKDLVDSIYQKTICSYFAVNNIRRTASDFSTERKGTTDLVNITIKLTMRDNDYNLKIS